MYHKNFRCDGILSHHLFKFTAQCVTDRIWKVFLDHPVYLFAVNVMSGCVVVSSTNEVMLVSVAQLRPCLAACLLIADQTLLLLLLLLLLFLLGNIAESDSAFCDSC